MNRTSHAAVLSGKSKIIEIIGPAGAGKTTLYNAFRCHHDQVSLENFPDVHKGRDIPFFISNGFQLFPRLIGWYRFDGRQLTRREFAWLSILYGWSGLLRKESQQSNKAIILDQGPIYLLAEMLLFGPDYLRQKSVDHFWQDLYGRWSITLDMVVVLDAANTILLERIRTRQQDLVVKDQPADIVYEYLNSYRSKYDFLISVLAANNADLKVLQFDTGCESTQHMVDKLFSELTAH